MIVITTDIFEKIVLADVTFPDYSDTSRLYDKPVQVIDRAPYDEDPTKTWKTRRLPRGKKIYQLGVEIPVLSPLKS